jgi:predicted nucleic acid-binding protein
MKTFLDTNILVYTMDPRDPVKQSKARALLNSGGRIFAISTQVWQEFYVTVVGKCGVAPLKAKAILQSMGWAELTVVRQEEIERAIDLQILNQLSFWDALIISAAVSARCSVLWSEDLTAGQVIAGVRIENPLASV